MSDDRPLEDFACASPDSSFSDGDIRLAYGEKPDGTIVHINDVPSGLACDCRCPACGDTLVAHKGPKKRHHFAHLAATECHHATETALHKLAKEILNEERRLWVPEVTAEHEGVFLPKHRARYLDLEDAILEKPLEGMVPDVMVRKSGRELLVEIFVTHRCGAEKIGRIRARGSAALEIDLSRLPRDAPKDVVARAIIRQAPRQWLFNSRLEAAKAELTASILRRREAARQEAVRRIEKLVALNLRAKERQPDMPEADTEDVRRVVEAGYEEAIGVPIAGDYCFGVGRRRWQAAVFAHAVFGPIRDRFHWPTISTKTVWKFIKGARLLGRPEFAMFVDEHTADIVRAQVPDYQPPYAVIEGYLEQLQRLGILRGGNGNGWIVTDRVLNEWDRRKRLQRELEAQRDSFEQMVSGILNALPQAETDRFDRSKWVAQMRPEFGISFATALEFGDRRLSEMCSAVREVQSMLLRGGKIVDRLLGLPIEAARTRAIEKRRLAAEEKARLDKENRIAGLKDFITILREAGWEIWLSAPLSPFDAQTPLDLAAESAEGLERAKMAAVAERDRRRLARARAVEKTRCVETLEDRARRTLKRTDLVGLFMDTGQPSLRGRRPREYCVDEETLKICIELLQPGLRRQQR